jgi:glycosyltransferase involved in cell wall biosynthesis
MGRSGFLARDGRRAALAQIKTATAPAAPQRPIVFDVTHLISRLPTLASTGIDRIDLAYAAHFAVEGRMAAGVHYGLRRPHLLSVGQARAFVRLSQSRWSRAYRGGSFSATMQWLESPPSAALRTQSPPTTAALQSIWTCWAQQWKGRLLDNRSLRVPRGALYLNVAQHMFEHPIFFRWLARRRDLCNVMMIHDLLPLDYPEFFWPANLPIFRRRLATAFRHASAFVVSTHAVKARLELELSRQGAPRRPIHVEPFPSPLEGANIERTSGSDLRGHPYFVVLGTIEPRKNHLLLLHLWRRLVSQPGAPRLVLVGARGWESEQVADMLDRCFSIRRHVLEIAGLRSADLAELLRGARALLMPSFDEGYGLPLVEALSLGTPAIASDIAVFREVTQGCATFLSPIEGPAWEREVSRLATDQDYAVRKREEAARFRSPTWSAYFRRLDDFLRRL